MRGTKAERFAVLNLRLLALGFAAGILFLVDGFLALAALWLWSLAGRVERPVAPG